MTKVLNLAAEARTGTGKGPARAVRREKKIPAVIYGDKKAPVTISVNPMEFNKLYLAGNFFTKLVDIKVDNQTIRVLPRDVQVDPLTEHALHADFLRVSDKTQIRVSIPIHVKNEAKCPGLKKGGVLNLVAHEIEVMCLASDIPEYFEINIESMDINQSVHLNQMTLPKGVTPTARNMDMTVLAINPPTVVKEETPATAAAAAAPADGAAAPAAGAAAPAAGKAAAPAAAGKDAKPAPAKK